jgi:Spy/CpxP family protein refolding chaperone
MGPNAGECPGGGLGPRHGQGPRDRGPGAGPLSELELTAEQQEALAALRQEHHTARMALMQQFRNGELTEEQFRTASQDLREQHQAAVAALLTEEQNAQLAQLRAERVLKNLERSLQRLQDRAEQHLALMTRILDLNDDQVAAAQALHEEAVTSLSGIVESLRSGALGADEARQAAQDLRDQSRTAFRDLLTPEQQTLFDSLEQLRGGRRFGRRH